jgi:signal peptidase II
VRGLQERGTVAPLTGARRRPYVVVAAVAAAVVVADQATTSWALADLHGPVHLVGPLGLTLQYNSGTAFSLFTGAGWGIVPLVAVLVVAVGWLAWRSRSTLLSVGYGLVLGGALGNLADRVVRGHHGDVVDYVSLSHWPTFNVADACITAGIVVVALGWLRQPVNPTQPHDGHGRGAAGPRAGHAPPGRPLPRRSGGERSEGDHREPVG